MPLSDAAIRALKPKADAFSVTDEKGLSLLVKPTGSKLWRFRYQFQGKPRVMALGSYPEVPLSEARRKRDTARMDVQAGIDPGAEKKKAKLLSVLATANTFSAIAEEYIVTKLIGENRAAITIDKARWLLSHLSPIASLPVAEIKPQELYAALKRLEGSGKHETARRCRSFSSRVFRYAVVTGRAETDPAAMLSGALIIPKVKHHAAPIDPAKVGDVYLGRIVDIADRVANRDRGQALPERLRDSDDGQALFGILKGDLISGDSQALPVDEVAEIALDIVQIIKGHLIVDLWSNEVAQNHLRNAIDDYFFDELRDNRGLILSVDHLDALEQKIIDLARARFKI